MKNFYKVVTAFLLVVIIGAMNSYAYADSSLDRFDKNLKKNDKSSGKQKGGSRKKDYDMFAEDDSSVFGDLIASLLLIAILYPAVQSMKTGYNEFPYESEGQDSAYISKEYEKKWMAEFSTSYHYLDSETWAGEANLHSKVIPPLGPEINYTRYFDRNESLTHMRMGTNYTWFQNNGLLIDSNLQYSGLRGIRNFNGFAIGIMASVYPIRPLVLNIRYGFDIYRSYDFDNFEARIGLILNRYEVFTGYERFGPGKSSLESYKFGFTIFL